LEGSAPWWLEKAIGKGFGVGEDLSDAVDQASDHGDDDDLLASPARG
jgi:hypothetical protein